MQSWGLEYQETRSCIGKLEQDLVLGERTKSMSTAKNWQVRCLALDLIRVGKGYNLSNFPVAAQLNPNVLAMHKICGSV